MLLLNPVSADMEPTARFSSTEITSVEGDGEIVTLEVKRDGDVTSCSDIGTLSQNGFFFLSHPNKTSLFSCTRIL